MMALKTTFCLFLIASMFIHIQADMPSCERAKCVHCQVELVHRMCPTTCAPCNNPQNYNNFGQRSFIANGQPNVRASDSSQPLRLESPTQVLLSQNQQLPQTQQPHLQQPHLLQPHLQQPQQNMHYSQNQQNYNMQNVQIPRSAQQIPQQQYYYNERQQPQLRPQYQPQQPLNFGPSQNNVPTQNPFQLFSLPQMQQSSQSNLNPFHAFLNPVFGSLNNNQQQTFPQNQNNLTPQFPNQQQTVNLPQQSYQIPQNQNMHQQMQIQQPQQSIYHHPPSPQINIPQAHIPAQLPNIVAKPNNNQQPQLIQTASSINSAPYEHRKDVNPNEQFKPRQIYNVPYQQQQKVDKIPTNNFQNGPSKNIVSPPSPTYIPTMPQPKPTQTNIVPVQIVPQPIQPSNAVQGAYPFAGVNPGGPTPYTSNLLVDKKGKNQCPRQPNWEPCIDKNLANDRFKSCCTSLGEGCAQLCSYDQSLTTIQLAVLTGRCPLNKVGDMMVCASGYEDATQCCEAYGVFEPGFEQCRPYCNPSAGLPNDGILSEKYKCLGKLNQIQRCFYVTQRP